MAGKTLSWFDRGRVLARSEQSTGRTAARSEEELLGKIRSMWTGVPPEAVGEFRKGYLTIWNERKN